MLFPGGQGGRWSYCELLTWGEEGATLASLVEFSAVGLRRSACHTVWEENRKKQQERPMKCD